MIRLLRGEPLRVENVALMARMFDFDGLRALSERLQQRSRAQARA